MNKVIKFFKSAKGKLITGSVVGIIVVFFVFFQALNIYVGSEGFKKSVNSEFTKATGLELGYKKMNISLEFPLSVNVKLEEPVVDYVNADSLFSSEKLNVRMDILPLLFKTVKISSLDASKLRINLARTVDGEFVGLQKLMPSDKNQSAASAPKSSSDMFNIILHDVKITDYKFVFVDAFDPFLLEIVAQGDNILIDNFDLKKDVSAKVDGKFLINGNEHFNYKADIKVNLASVMKDMEGGEAAVSEDNSKQEMNPVIEIAKNNLRAELDTKLNIKSLNNINGNFKVTKLSAKINDYQLPESGIDIVFKGHNLGINSELYVSRASVIKVNGKADFKKKVNTDIAVKTSEISMVDLRNFVAAIETIIPGVNIRDVLVGGSFLVDAKVKSSADKLDCSGYINLNRISVGYKGFKPSLNNLNGRIALNSNGVVIDNIKANIDKSPLVVSGNIDNKMIANITAMVPSLNLHSLFESLKESKNIDTETKKQIDKVKSLSGVISAKAILAGKLETIQPKVEIRLSSFNIKHQDLPVPLTVNNGLVSLLDGKLKVDIPSLFLNSPSSSFNINGNVDFDDDIKFNLLAKGKLNEKDMAKLAGMQGLAKGSVPVTFEISGTPEKISTKAVVSNSSSNYLLLTGFDQNTNIVLDGVLENNSFEIVNTGLYTTNSKKLLDVSGKINALNQKQPSLANVRVHTVSPIKVNLPVGISNSSFLAGDLLLNGVLTNPQMKGYLKVQNLVLPDMGVSAGVIDIKIENNLLSVKIPDLKAKSSSLSINAQGPSKFSMPYTISNVAVVSSFLNIDEVGSIFASVPASPAANTVASSASLKSASTGDSPVLIKTGSLKVSRLMLNKTEFNNLTSNFSLDKKYNAILSSLKTSTMGGTASGKVVYNLMNGAVDMSVHGSDINSDTFAVKFLGMPSKTISGNASADANLKFSGVTPEEITKTLNGTVNITISDGEMGNLGRLDFYLKASNILSNNAVSAAINKVINLSTLNQTGKFNKAYGTLTFSKGGNININSLKTQGPKMSIYMKGNLNDITFNGNLQVIGRLSQDMVDALGPLSQAAFDKVVSKLTPLTELLNIPLTGFQTTEGKSDRAQVPKLNDNSDGAGMFLVKINGNVFKPASVKMFKWIKDEVQQTSSSDTTQPDSDSSSQSQTNQTGTQTDSSADTTQTGPSADQTQQSAQTKSNSAADKAEKIENLIKGTKQILLDF